jgi:hypothetical protein
MRARLSPRACLKLARRRRSQKVVRASYHDDRPRSSSSIGAQAVSLSGHAARVDPTRAFLRGSFRGGLRPRRGLLFESRQTLARFDDFSDAIAVFCPEFRDGLLDPA